MASSSTNRIQYFKQEEPSNKDFSDHSLILLNDPTLQFIVGDYASPLHVLKITELGWKKLESGGNQVQIPGGSGIMSDLFVGCESRKIPFLALVVSAPEGDNTLAQALELFLNLNDLLNFIPMNHDHDITGNSLEHSFLYSSDSVNTQNSPDVTSANLLNITNLLRPPTNLNDISFGFDLYAASFVRGCRRQSVQSQYGEESCLMGMDSIVQDSDESSILEIDNTFLEKEASSPLQPVQEIGNDSFNWSLMMDQTLPSSLRCPTWNLIHQNVDDEEDA